MGKGKGSPSSNIALSKSGQNFAVIYFKKGKETSIAKDYSFLVEELLKKIINKLPSGFFFSRKS